MYIYIWDWRWDLNYFGYMVNLIKKIKRFYFNVEVVGGNLSKSIIGVKLRY